MVTDSFFALACAGLIGILFGLALVIVTIRFNLQKWVVIIAAGVLGAATIVGSIVLMFNPHAQVLEKPVQAVLKASPLAAILFIVVAILGIVMQVRSTRDYA